MKTDHDFWKTILAAWVHDPAEKALVLLRGKSHEEGTTSELFKMIFSTDKIPDDLAGFVKKADHWAAAGDRVSLPWKKDQPYYKDLQVKFADRPELVHPISPKTRIEVKETFRDVVVEHLESVSTDHFEEFIVKNGDGIDYKKTFLRFWRFGPETPAKGLNILWQVLPADTRCPDHTIWDHLKFCSCFAGIFSLGDEPALLAVSLGPVQGFIAQARSVSDLWAGSHFLSQLAWQAMLPIVEKYGPDFILFPDLHGVPAVDQWLVKESIWPSESLKPWEYETEVNGKKEIKTVALDRDPRMAAALPNRFVAVVPSGSITDITNKIREDVSKWAKKQTEVAAEKFFKKAGSTSIPDVAKEQIERQMAGFPEIYFSAVPWSVVREENGKVNPEELFRMFEVFLPEGETLSKHDEGTWDILSRPLKSRKSDWTFFEPNRGAAYPHIYNLTDRLHAASKATRNFKQVIQEGYRCTICGEREWLTDNRNLLFLPRGQRKESPWNKVEDALGSVRKGEHLCAWCTLKRFWPSVYPEMVKAEGKRRFVVSTHTMALATSIESALERIKEVTVKHDKLIRRLSGSTAKMDRAAFPRRLWRKLRDIEVEHPEFFNAMTKLPVLLDCLSDQDEKDEGQLREIEKDIKKLLGDRLETYYALILMDGDRMGEWVAGSSENLPRYKEILHSSIVNNLENEFSEIQEFLNSRRPNTPARHQAISKALNNFSLNLARIVVEEMFNGKLIYAGGDDLMAMVSVPALPALMLALRALYSGVLFDEEKDEKSKLEDLTGRKSANFKVKLKKGYALFEKGKNRNLYTTMGPEATASIGAVVAHHKAPLARVLRSLRSAEQKAKNEGGRDAFCITIEKRAGGTSHLVGKWWFEDPVETEDPLDTTMGVLISLSRALAGEGVSRRAAYIIHEQLRDIPPDRDAIEKTIAYRLDKQGINDKKAAWLASRLAELAEYHSFLDDHNDQRGSVPPMNKWLQNFFITAEFFARPERNAKGGEGE
jgi:CRISPR-associated protein Cmr2